MPEVNAPAGSSPDVAAIIAAAVSKAMEGPMAALADLKKQVDAAPVKPPFQVQETPAQTKSYQIWGGRREDEEKGLGAAQYLRAMAMSKAERIPAQAWAEKNYGPDHRITKALGAQTFGSGGALLPDVLATELIEFLREEAVVRKMGARAYPMENGKLRIAKITGTSQASWVGENTNAPKTEPTTGELELSAKKLAAIVPISMDLVRRVGPAADALVRDDLVRSITLSTDIAYIRGIGTQYTPKGLRLWAPTANVLTMTATPTLATVTTDMRRMYLTLRRNNVRMISPGWLFAPGTGQYLYDLTSTTGQFIYRDEMNQGKFRKIPYVETTSILENLGGGSDTEFYLVDFADAVIGETLNLTIDASDTAAYDDNGTVRAAYSLDQMVIKAIQEVDFGMRHDASVAVMTGVTWGN